MKVNRFWKTMFLAGILTVSCVSGSEAGAPVGGWQIQDKITLTDEAKDAFDKAMEKAEEAGEYEAQALLGTQIVAGVNYCILCRPAEEDASGYVIMYIYQDPEGNAEIIGTQDLILSVPFESETEKETEGQTGPGEYEPTLGEANALSSAKNYLNSLAFSYDGLVKQLKFEGYSDTEAVYAADHCEADWNEQAAKSAQNYLTVMEFTRESLITQLVEFEGFTHEQAEYGAAQAGF